MLGMNDKVVICCPSGTDQKYPAFFRAFNGRLARFIGDVLDDQRRYVDTIRYQNPDKVVSKWVRVDIGTRENQVHMTVDRRWLARVD